jgi:hypothetical protein
MRLVILVLVEGISTIVALVALVALAAWRRKLDGYSGHFALVIKYISYMWKIEHPT